MERTDVKGRSLPPATVLLVEDEGLSNISLHGEKFVTTASNSHA